MPRSPDGLSLPGYLQIANRKWERCLTMHKGGPYAQNEVQLHLTGKAPGGFQMQIMQADIVLFMQWNYRNIKWGVQQRSWAIHQAQFEEAESILKESGLLDQFES